MQVTLPEMGESVTEGTVAKWLKQPGDSVREGEALVEVTTDKVDAEVPAPATGKLLKILADAGQTIAVGAPLAEIEVGADGGAAPNAADLESRATPAAEKPARTEAKAPTPQPAPPDGGAKPASMEVTEGAELLARARGVDLATVKGTGPGGSIRRRDIMQAPGSGRRCAAAGDGDSAPRNLEPQAGAARPGAIPDRRDPAARCGGRAGQAHGGKPRSTDGDEFSNRPGRRARSATQAAKPGDPECRAAREALLHAPDRLRDRQGRDGRAVDGGDL